MHAYLLNILALSIYDLARLKTNYSAMTQLQVGENRKTEKCGEKNLHFVNRTFSTRLT